jgi:ribose transport system substrate-binding protein
MSTKNSIRLSKSRLYPLLAASAVAGLCLAGIAPGNVEAASRGKPSPATDIAYAKAQVAKYRGLPKFVSPGPAFDISKVHGKSVAVIPAASNTFDNTIEAQMKKLAAAYGVKYTEYPNQGEPTQWVSEMDEAITSHPNLIILNTALNPSEVLPEVKRAKAAGIPVIATHFFDQTYSQSLHTSCGAPAGTCAAGVVAVVNAQFNPIARIESDWIIQNSKADADVLVITTTDAASAPGMLKAIKGEFAAHCSNCKVTVLTLPVATWESKISTDVSTAVTRNPHIDYILPVYDFGASFAAEGLTLAGKSKSVKIVSYNGTQSVLQLLEKGSPVVMDVGEPLDWLGYAFMDQAFRILAGVKPVVNEHTPFRVFTHADIAQTGTPPTVTGGYGNAYIAGYESLWKTG